jgi:TRAP-type C4-dicarboxylate transport system substrate-binding protein
MAFLGANYHPSNLPLFLMLDTIYNSHEDFVAAILAAIETVESEPNLKAEMEREKIVLLAPYHGGSWVLGFKKSISSVRDLKGMTIRSIGGVRAEFYKQLGVTPVNVVASDHYEALDRGTIDGWGDGALLAVSALKIHEITKYIYMINAGSGLSLGICMNLDVYRSLPQDVQEMLSKLKREYGIRFAQNLMDSEGQMYSEWEKKYGGKRIYPSPEDQKVLLEAGRKANELFIKKQESAGHKAAGDVVSFYMNALKKYEDERSKKK